MQGCGVTHAVLLTPAAGETHAKAEMAERPDRFVRFVSVDPSRADAIEILRKAAMGGAKGFGEMKSRVAADRSGLFARKERTFGSTGLVGALIRDEPRTTPVIER